MSQIYTANKNRNAKIDICRFIGICMMVIGHSGCPTAMKNYIYLFHMALFFFLSGFCYKEKNDTHPVLYFWNKVKTIYFPYIAFNSIFVLLHNLFLSLKLYASDEAFLLLEGGNEYGIMSAYSLKDTVIQIIRTLLFAANEEMGGATWFLRILFLVCLLHCFIGFILNKIKKANYRELSTYIIGIAFLIIGWLFYAYDIHLPLEIQTVFSAFFPFALGVLWKNHIDEWLKKRIGNTLKLACLLISGVALVIMSRYHSIGLGLNSIVNPLFYGSATLLGITHVYVLSHYISIVVAKLRIIGEIIDSIAKGSMWIVCLHFLAFKLVTLLIVKLYNLPDLYLAAFPSLIMKGAWWLAYLFVGIVLPVASRFLVNSTFRRKREIA